MVSRRITRRAALGLIGGGTFAAGAARPFPALAAAGEPRLLTATVAGGGFGFEGTSPGPQLRVRRGDEVFVRLANRLERPIALHWHGVRLANPFDGVPGLTQDPVAPGGSFEYRFVAPDAGTFWYHPTGSRALTELTEGGLWGVLLVDEVGGPAVDRDIVLAIGAALQPQELVLAPNERARLRLVNPSVARLASLAFAGFEPFVVALDGQPVNEPFLPAQSRLDLAPGGRADIILDATMGEGQSAGIAALRDGQVVEVLRLTRGSQAPARAERLQGPPALPSNGLPAEIPLADSLRAELKLGAALSLSAPPLFQVRRGRPVTLALVNDTQATAAVHVHGHAFRLLHARDDGWEPYWLDTVAVNAGETVHVAFVADNPGKWALAVQPIDASERFSACWFAVEA